MKTIRTMTFFLLVVGAPWVAAGDKNHSDESGLSCQGGTASSFRLQGKIDNPRTFSADDLQQFPSSTVEVAFFAGNQGLVTKTYRGVALWDVIRAAWLVTDPKRKNDQLRKYVVVTGSDCYEAIVSLGEILPDFGGQHILLAYADGDGKPLGEEGAIRLVVPGDKKGGRYVSNIVQVSVRSAR